MCEGHGRAGAGPWGAALPPPGPWAYRAAACTAGSGSRAGVCAGSAEGGCLQGLQVGPRPDQAPPRAPQLGECRAVSVVEPGASRAALPGRSLGPFPPL